MTEPEPVDHWVIVTSPDSFQLDRDKLHFKCQGKELHLI